MRYRRDAVRDVTVTFQYEKDVLHVLALKAVLPGDFRINRKAGFEGDAKDAGYDGLIEVEGRNLRQTLKWIGIDTDVAAARPPADLADQRQDAAGKGRRSCHRCDVRTRRPARHRERRHRLFDSDRHHRPHSSPRPEPRRLSVDRRGPARADARARRDAGLAAGGRRTRAARAGLQGPLRQRALPRRNRARGRCPCRHPGQRAEAQACGRGRASRLTPRTLGGGRRLRHRPAFRPRLSRRHSRCRPDARFRGAAALRPWAYRGRPGGGPRGRDVEGSGPVGTCRFPCSAPPSRRPGACPSARTAASTFLAFP